MATVIIYFKQVFIICIGRVLWDISDIVTKSYGFYVIKKFLYLFPLPHTHFDYPQLALSILCWLFLICPPSLIYILLCLSQCPKALTSRKFSLSSSSWLSLGGKYQQNLKSRKRQNWVYISPISSAQMWLCRMLLCFMTIAFPMIPAINQVLVIS